MEAIRQTKVNMNVWLGIYISEDDTIWERQRQATLDIITEYGTDHISGITVGNEFLLNQANGAATAPAAAISSITTKVAQFKQDLAGMSLSKTLPVGTADAGSMVSTTLAAGVDYFMANVHPWFGGVPINQAAGWTYDYYTQQVAIDLGTTKGYIAETGWPSDANATQFLTYQGAVASVPNLQTCELHMHGPDAEDRTYARERSRYLCLSSKRKPDSIFLFRTERSDTQFLTA